MVRKLVKGLLRAGAKLELAIAHSLVYELYVLRYATYMLHTCKLGYRYEVDQCCAVMAMSTSFTQT